jgi:hypothetical protein
VKKAIFLTNKESLYSEITGEVKLKPEKDFTVQHSRENCAKQLIKLVNSFMNSDENFIYHNN